MSISGPVVDTLNGDRSGSSDGVDDSGRADGPQTLPGQSDSFGIAAVFKAPAESSSVLFGVTQSSGSTFRVIDNDFIKGAIGHVNLLFQDDASGDLRVATDKKFFDNTAQLMVLNKTGNTVTDIEMYFNDMKTPASLTRSANATFSPSSYTSATQMGFFARLITGQSPSRHKTVNASFFEFNGQPYSQQDRLDLKQRALGL
jgi:hypothetical protein